MRVKNILSGRSVITVYEDDDLRLATQLMLWAGVHHLPVLSRNDKLIGVLQERDILVRQTKVGAAAEREPVSSVMSFGVATVTPEEELSQAALLMIGRGVPCLIVVDAGRVIGTLTTTDFVQYLAEPELSATGGAMVRDVMHPRPLTAAVDDYLMDALARMSKRNIRHLPVVAGDGRVIGMLSDRDIRSAIGDPTRAMRIEHTRVRLQCLRVADVMSRRVMSVSDRAPLAEVAAQFIKQGSGALPVVDESEHLVGIVSYVDLLRAATFEELPRPRKRRVAARHLPQLQPA